MRTLFSRPLQVHLLSKPSAKSGGLFIIRELFLKVVSSILMRVRSRGSEIFTGKALIGFSESIYRPQQGM